MCNTWVTSVCSILTYGSEVWRLTTEVCVTLNGTNSIMVNVITGRTIRDKTTEDNWFDLLEWIRVRKLQWLVTWMDTYSGWGQSDRWSKPFSKYLRYHKQTTCWRTAQRQTHDGSCARTHVTENIDERCPRPVTTTGDGRINWISPRNAKREGRSLSQYQHNLLSYRFHLRHFRFRIIT